ncbi:MAG: phosphatase PAP2 family protein [Flavobacterium sp.]|nr:phosphatase PAP2 family protein [Flavobacterium sp.]
MIEKILEIDQKLFVFLNGLGSEKYDALWLLITNQLSWIPVFLIILVLLFKSLGWRHALLIIFVIAALITLTDQTTNIFKNLFERLRPVNNTELADLMRAVQHRNSFSFFSGHASNSMAVAFFLFTVMRPFRKYVGFIFLWPLIFAYSRIYLGLHYPLDIICGYIYGIFMALIMLRIYVYFRDTFFPDKKENLDNPSNSEPVTNG